MPIQIIMHYIITYYIEILYVFNAWKQCANMWFLFPTHPRIFESKIRKTFHAPPSFLSPSYIPIIRSNHKKISNFHYLLAGKFKAQGFNTFLEYTVSMAS